MGELMEYTDQLDKAAVTEDPYERWVGAAGGSPSRCGHRHGWWLERPQGASVSAQHQVTPSHFSDPALSTTQICAPPQKNN